MYNAISNKVIVKRTLPKEETTESGIIVANEDKDVMLEVEVVSASDESLVGSTVIVERPRMKVIDKNDEEQIASIELEYILAVKSKDNASEKNNKEK